MKPSPLRAALALMRSHRGSLVTALCLGVVATVASLAQPMVIGLMVGSVAAGSFEPGMLALLLGLFVAEGAVSASQAFVVGRAGNRIVLNVRETVVRRLLGGRMSDHFERRRGDTMTLLLSDTQLMSGALTQSMATMLVAAITVIGAVTMMVIIDPVLAGTTALCVVVAAGIGLSLAGRIKHATEDVQARVGDFGSAMERVLAALSTIKISRAEEREVARVNEHVGAAYRAGQRVVRLVAALLPSVNLGIQASYAVVFIVGALRLGGGALTLGVFT
ncbi:MAG: ABC transporter ATP-binding protein, partial [Nonomuraea sp.]|nr:ABC transporter ATP-binding protein [Nonomuraea sp.]